MLPYCKIKTQLLKIPICTKYKAHVILSIHDFEGDLFCEQRLGREIIKSYITTSGNRRTKPLKWEVGFGAVGGGIECYLLMFHDPLAHYNVSNMNPLLL